MSVHLPGQPIAITDAKDAGQGTYKSNGSLRAALVGIPNISSKGVVSLPRTRPHLPSQDSIVIGTVVRLSPQQATISITVVDGAPLLHGDDYTGVIRTQDVRATEKDKVKLSECFRGGDVVRGVVISLGDARSYYVSTARKDLGVIFATSEAGATLEAVSWEAMRCTKTERIEKRKVAKPDTS